jgi:hypothetical protein
VGTTFVESVDFSIHRQRFMDDAALRAFQNELLVQPNRGDVMPGCGGLRKVRTADPSRGKGKRGGARVIYLLIPEADRIDLLLIYGKDEQDDLTPAQRKTLSRLADRMRKEATARKAGKSGK